MKMSKAERTITVGRLSNAVQSLSRAVKELQVDRVPISSGLIIEIRDSLVELLGHAAERVSRGRCKFCGCSAHHACILGGDAPYPCAWYNQEQTVCTNPDCQQRLNKELSAPLPRLPKKRIV